MKRLEFPNSFVWGVATSAYQIEGAWNEDGRRPSIWDTFSHRRGKVNKNENGDVAADHYHRWKQDVALMADMGVQAYRFSTSWTRIQPAGSGPVNQKGLEFYNRLVDELLRRGIQPYLCLFHYDLPQVLQDKGGWPNRDTAYQFAEYAAIMARSLGDRVHVWFTHNEPWVTAFVGYLMGTHAPGVRNPRSALRSIHHVLLSHGLAAQAICAEARMRTQVGITLNLTPVEPATGSPKDAVAADRVDMFMNRIVLDPLLRGTSPVLNSAAAKLLTGRVVHDRDMDVIRNVDILGVNYYSRAVVKHDRRLPLVNARQIRPKGSEYSAMWEIHPEGMYNILCQVWNYRPTCRLMVTENGIPVPDCIDAEGRVRDEQRICYLSRHIAQVHRAIQDGIPVEGYFHWSLLDNFEWNLGYAQRFGLVYVDYKTQQRILKDSGRWFAQVIRQNGLEI